MKIGDIVVIKALSLMGEVIAIDEMDKATLTLCGTGLEVIVDIADLEVTDSNQPHREAVSYVNILGTKYKILIIEKNDYRSEENTDGWCDSFAKEILLYNYIQSVDSVKDLEAYQRKVLRHEIIHAFLYESGLWQNAYGSKCWAKNEEMVDWMAIQEPKIHKAFKEAGCDE